MASDKSTSPGSIAFSPINTALASNTPDILAQARALASMTPANQLQASVSPGAVSGYQSPFAASDAANSNRSELASPKFVGPQVEHLNFTIEEVQAIKDKQHDLYQDFWILRDNWANKDSPSNVKSLNKIDDRRLEKIFLLGKNLQHLVGLTTEIYEKFAGGETILKKVADSMESKKNAFAKELDDLILAACNLRRRLEGSGHKYDAPVEFKAIGNQVHVPKTKKKNTKRGLTPASLSEDITLDTSAEFLGLIPASEPPRKKRAMGDGRTIVKIGPKRNAQRGSSLNFIPVHTPAINGFGTPASAFTTPTLNAVADPMYNTNDASLNETVRTLNNALALQMQMLNRTNEQNDKLAEEQRKREQRDHEKDLVIVELKHQLERMKSNNSQ